MIDKKFEQAKFSILLEQMENLQYALETLHKKVGLENASALEEAISGVFEYYTTMMNDLLFEARAESSDPANGHAVDTEWLSKVLKNVQAGMGDY